MPPKKKEFEPLGGVTEGQPENPETEFCVCTGPKGAELPCVTADGKCTLCGLPLPPETFEPGDTVYRKDDGREMTVVEVGDNDITCE